MDRITVTNLIVYLAGFITGIGISIVAINELEDSLLGGLLFIIGIMMYIYVINID